MLESKGKYRSWIPHGFDYYSPERAQTLVATKDRIRNLFTKSGYREILLPAFDYARTFRITSRHPVQNEIFETRDSDGDMLGVHSDLTVQVIKGASHGHFGKEYPARLFYIQPVYHDIPWGSGKRREVIQGGVELIGGPAESRFTEVLDLARRTMQELGIPIRFVYGDARFVEALFGKIPGEFRSEISTAFHIKDTRLLKELAARAGLPGELTRLLTRVPITIGGEPALEKLIELSKPFADLQALLEKARAYTDIVYDFSLVRELTYYTGPVFEGYTPNSRERIVSGGVYDDLHEIFCGKPATACGFAVNLTELIDIEQSSEYITTARTGL